MVRVCLHAGTCGDGTDGDEGNEGVDDDRSRGRPHCMYCRAERHTIFQGEEDKDGRPAPAWAAQEQRGAANSAGLFGWSYTPHTRSLLFTPPPLIVTSFRAARRAADPPPPTPLFPHLCFTPA